MKKIVMTFSLAVAILTANAQNQTTSSTTTATTPATTPILSKRGYAILPEAGDWGVSFNAIPLMNYVGSVFSSGGNNLQYGAGNNNAFPSFLQTGAITVRKFQDANTAFRGMVRFDLTSNSTKNMSVASSTTGGSFVTDKASQSNSNIMLGAGIEKRKGIGRVQGIYGAMLAVGKVGTGYKYTYGNSLNTAGTAAYTNYNSTQTAGGDNINTNGTTTGTSRVTSDKGVGSMFTVGVVGFAGVEYFIAPKVSLGAEFQWGPSIGISGKEKLAVESISGTGSTSSKTYTTSSGASTIGFTTISTSVNLNFFF